MFLHSFQGFSFFKLTLSSVSAKLHRWEAFRLGACESRPAGRAGELLLTGPESALWRAVLQSRVLLGARLGVGDIFHAGYESTLSNYVAGQKAEIFGKVAMCRLCRSLLFGVHNQQPTMSFWMGFILSCIFL